MEITIVGKGPSIKECLFDTEEIWGVNNTGSHPAIKGKPATRFTRCFSFDPEPREDWIKEMKGIAPICSWQPYADIIYPKNEVLDYFKTDYFTNSATWAIALAIYWKVTASIIADVTKIKLYGIDLVFGTIYAYEYRGIDYWLGRAAQAGIEVYAPESAHMLKTLYGGRYGEPRKYTMPLDFQERMQIMKLLPQEGRYEEGFLAQSAYFYCYPHVDEMEYYHIAQNQVGDQLSFSGENFTVDVGFSDQVFEYIRKMLIDLEKAGKLPFTALSLYQKFVLVDRD